MADRQLLFWKKEDDPFLKTLFADDLEPVETNQHQRKMKISIMEDNNMFKKANKSIFFVLFGLACSVLCACATTNQGGSVEGQSSSPLVEGKFSPWMNLVDEVEVVQLFNLDDYKKIIIPKLDTSTTPLPSQADNTYYPTLSILSAVDTLYAQGLQTAFSRSQFRPIPEIIQSAKPDQLNSDVPALIVRGKVNQMNPGSKAARFWIGFGAGKTRVEIEGEVFDSITGNILLRYKHARCSAMRFFSPGEYEELLTNDTVDNGIIAGMMLLYFQNLKKSE